MKKKILFVITKSNWGGAQRYVFDLVSSLPKDQFDVVVALGGSGGKDAPPGLLAEKLKALLGVRTIFIKNFMRDMSLIREFSAFSELLGVLKSERPDIVHLNSSKAGGIGALSARLLGIEKIIFTVHGWSYNEDRFPVAKLFFWLASWFTALLATDVIVLGEREERQLLKMPGISGRKVHLIHLGIKKAEVLEKESARTKLNVDVSTANTRWLGTIAELHRNKGIRYGIEATALLKERGVDVSYLLIGGGEEREPLERLARDLDISDRVHFLGFIPDAPKYLAAFDVFLLPSIKEGMPYVLLEAASAGVPIVMTNVGGGEIAAAYEGIEAVPPADPRAIADAVQKMTSVEPGRPTAENRFPLSTMLEKTVALYLPA